MSTSTAQPRKLSALRMHGPEGIIHPRREPHPHKVAIYLSDKELSSLLDFTHAVKRKTDRRITHQSVLKTALVDWLYKHRAWVKDPTDRRPA
jgi:hypothetical protein